MVWFIGFYEDYFYFECILNGESMDVDRRGVYNLIEGILEWVGSWKDLENSMILLSINRIKFVKSYSDVGVVNWEVSQKS